MVTNIQQHQLAERLDEFIMLQHLLDTEGHRRGHGNAFQGQGKILVVLAQEDNISQKELAERLNLTPQSTAEFVSKLVKKGFVTKYRSPADGRITLVQLTEAGKAQTEHIEQTLPDYINYLDVEEQAQLNSILGKIINGLRNDVENNGKPIRNLAHKLMYSRVINAVHEGEIEDEA
ncbi:MAG: MarR family transcriptional regulator [Lactobacillaceae bacterium]|jgi:DNA-binding MarR family transcriptional regulator|nr:MarR family transcriptional regulator [Lactobacillaceae bacterium]